MAVQDILTAVSDRIGGAAKVDTVFGEAKVMDGRAIIPVAAVLGGFGAGGGEGKMPTCDDGQTQEGSGGGGGGWFLVRPLAMIEVTPSETKLIPVLDMTRIILAALGLLSGGLIMWYKARMKSPRHNCR